MHGCCQISTSEGSPLSSHGKTSVGSGCIWGLCDRETRGASCSSQWEGWRGLTAVPATHWFTVKADLLRTISPRRDRVSAAERPFPSKQLHVFVLCFFAPRRPRTPCALRVRIYAQLHTSRDTFGVDAGHVYLLRDSVCGRKERWSGVTAEVWLRPSSVWHTRCIIPE